MSVLYQRFLKIMLLAYFLIFIQVTSGQICPPGEFSCNDSNGCLLRDWVCNGVLDCPDGSDETSDLCSSRPCSSDLESFSLEAPFRCSYGACISGDLVCNGYPDCHDRSDETEELCKNVKCDTGRFGRFRCDYGGCISIVRLCTNINDCVDGSDETAEACKHRKCSSRSQFECHYGSCIDKSLKCNKRYDCLDKSDETLELCGYSLEEPTFLNTTITPEITQKPPIVTIPITPVKLNFTFPAVVDQVLCRLDSTPGMKIDIISCGNPEDLSEFVRSGDSRLCLDEGGGVPVSTTVLSNCWGISKTLMTCNSDGLWHPYIIDFNSTTNQQKPMKHLCQPSVINSNVCGKRPRYIRDDYSNNYINRGRPRMIWPWLVGLIKETKFVCTGTIITPNYILTAGHCITSSQDTSSITMHPADLKIQRKNEDDNIERVRVASIRLHPLFQNGRRPKNDIALIELEKEILFSRYVYPACIHHNGGLLFQKAMVFKRLEGEEQYKWKKLSQDYDFSCYSEDRCAESLVIGGNEFCGLSSDSNDYLEPGSSGGPYLINLNNDIEEHWAIAGVVSYSVENGCSRPHTVYTDVSGLWCWVDNCVQYKQCQNCPNS